MKLTISIDHELVIQLKKLAYQERRRPTDQAAVLLEKALSKEKLREGFVETKEAARTVGAARA